MITYNEAAVRQETVRVGSRVRVRDLEGEEEFTIVPTEEVDFSLGRISMDAPLARALLGHSVGERVKVRAPGGLRAVSILSVE
jgi:transcription elongation factor GreA